MNFDFYLLFNPIFWDKEKMLSFLVGYFELLHQGRWHSDIHHIINDLNNKKSSYVSLPCNPFHQNGEIVHEGRCGWLDKVWETENTFNGQLKTISFIGEYLKYTKNSYNGHHWFDMLRAIRNSYVHKYDTKVKGYNSLSQDEKNKVKQMQSSIRNLIADGYLDYWIRKFPDLLFVIYHHAVMNYKVYLKLPGTVEDCNLRKHFIEKFYLEENASVSRIPLRLEDVVTQFANFSTAEAKESSGLLLHSIKLVEGPLVHFMKYPTSKYLVGIYTPNEVVVMTLSLDSSTASRNLTCRIDRKLNTTGENRMLVGFNLKLFKEVALKPKSTLTFNQTAVQNLSSDVINSLYIFTDEIMCALLYQIMFFNKRKFDRIFIFTNKAFREVSEISQNVFEQLDQNVEKVEISLEKLNVDYKDKLFKEPFLIQTKSRSTLELNKVYNNTAISLKGISENKLLELMHDCGPALLSTGIPLHFNENVFYCRELESGNGECLTDLNLKQKLLKVKTVTLIYSTACMGKTWLLASIGRYLETENQLVTFQKATDLVKVLKKNDNYNIRVIIEKLWRSSKLEQDVVLHQNNLNKGLYVLIDGFSDLINQKQKDKLSHFIEKLSIIPNVKLVVTLSDSDLTRDCFNNCESFYLKPIDIDGFMKHYFQDIIKKAPKTSSSLIVSLRTKYEAQCGQLGRLLQTPFVCSIWCSAYKKYVELGKPLKRKNHLSVLQIHSDLVNQQLKSHYPNFQHYVNKTVLMWPYLIKSFKEKFSDFTPDLSKFRYFTDLFGDRITSSALLMSDFLQGTVNDYLVAYLMEKIICLTDAGPLGTKMCKQFWTVLQVDHEKNKFVYGNIVQFLNKMSSVEMVAQVMKTSADGVEYSEIHNILSFSLKCEYDQLFESILAVIDPYKLEPNLIKLDPEDKIFVTSVFKKACEENNYTVVDNLVTLDCVQWDYKDLDGLTCLNYVEMYISDVTKMEELVDGINAWLNLIK